MKDVLARQRIELTFRDLIEKVSVILSPEGVFSVIIPSESAQEFENLAEDFGLYLVRKVNIFGIENGVLKRNVLEFSKKKSALETLDFTIEKSPRKILGPIFRTHQRVSRFWKIRFIQKVLRYSLP